MRTAHIDCGFAFTVFVSLYATIVWLETGQRTWYWLAIVFTAWSLGTRYHALFSLGGLAILIFLCAWWRQKTPRSALMEAARFFLLSSAGLVPWGIVNWIQTGNPLFPLLNDIFRSPYWTQQQTEAILNQQLESGIPVRLSNWWAVVTNFFNLGIDRPDFHGNIGLFYLLLVPILLFLRRIPAAIRLILGFSGCFWLLWIFTGQHARYLLGILPALAIAAAYSLATCLERWGNLGGRIPASVTACLLASLALFQSPLLERFGGYSRYGHALMESLPWNTLVGSESREHYLSRQILAFPVVEYLNAIPGKKKVLFWWNADPPIFYLDGESAYSLSPLFPQLYGNTNARVLHVLLENRVTHIVVAQLPPDKQSIVDPESEFAQRYLKKLYQRNSIVVYALSPAPLDQETVSFDFLNHLEEATLRMPSEPPGKTNTDYRAIIAIGEDTRYALVTHPPADIDFTLALPANPLMRFAIARRWPPCTSVGSFQLWIEGTDEVRRLLFDRKVSEPNALNEPGWFDEELDLTAYAGQRVKMIFQTSHPEGGPCDWYLWADPQIISKSTARP